MRFSIVVTIYQGSQNKDEIGRLLDSISSQKFQDYELILVHDGEWLEDPIVLYKEFFEKFPEHIEVAICNSEKRENIWGHNSRNIGIRNATGEYVIVTNGDNVFYNVLHLIDLEIQRKAVYIPLIKMNGLHKIDNTFNYYDTPRNLNCHSYVDGKPLILGNIDCFSLIVPLDYWACIGYWHDYSYASDFSLAKELSSYYECISLPIVLGEHN